MTTTEKPKNMDEYINGFPLPAQHKLRELREILRKAAPGASEGLKWGQPALSYDWILFQFAAFKNHVSLYPTPSAVSAFMKDLADYKTSSSTIQFPLDQPLPLELISRIAAFRVQEAKNGVKWM